MSSFSWGTTYTEVDKARKQPRDGDNDGFVDDGKPTMRPALPKLPAGLFDVARSKASRILKKHFRAGSNSKVTFIAGDGERPGRKRRENILSIEVKPETRRMSRSEVDAMVGQSTPRDRTGRYTIAWDGTTGKYRTSGDKTPEDRAALIEAATSIMEWGDRDSLIERVVRTGPREDDNLFPDPVESQQANVRSPQERSVPPGLDIPEPRVFEPKQVGVGDIATGEDVKEERLLGDLEAPIPSQNTRLEKLIGQWHILVQQDKDEQAMIDSGGYLTPAQKVDRNNRRQAIKIIRREIDRVRGAADAERRVEGARNDPGRQLRARESGGNIPAVKFTPKSLRQAKPGYLLGGKRISQKEADYLNRIGEAFRGTHGRNLLAVQELYGEGTNRGWDNLGLGHLSPDERVEVIVAMGKLVRSGNVSLTGSKTSPRFKKGDVRSVARILGHKVSRAGDQRPVRAPKRPLRSDPTGDAAVRNVEKGAAKSSIITTLRAARAFKEHLHPRDSKGRFANKAKGGKPNRPNKGDKRVDALHSLRESLRTQLPPPPPPPKNRKIIPPPPPAPKKGGKIPPPPSLDRDRENSLPDLPKKLRANIKERQSQLDAPDAAPKKPAAKKPAPKKKPAAKKPAAPKEPPPPPTPDTDTDSGDWTSSAQKHIADGGRLEDFEGASLMDLAYTLAGGKIDGSSGKIMSDTSSGDVIQVDTPNGTFFVKRGTTDPLEENVKKRPNGTDQLPPQHIAGDAQMEVFGAAAFGELGVEVPSVGIQGDGIDAAISTEHAERALERASGKKMKRVSTMKDFGRKDELRGSAGGPERHPDKNGRFGRYTNISAENPVAAADGGPKIENRSAILATALLDYVTGNNDRHSGNYMIGEAEDGTLYFVPIDNSLMGAASSSMEVAGVELGKKPKSSIFGHDVSKSSSLYDESLDGVPVGFIEDFDTDLLGNEEGSLNFDEYSEMGFAETLSRVKKSRNLWGMVLGQYAGDEDAFRRDLEELAEKIDGMDIAQLLEQAFGQNLDEVDPDDRFDAKKTVANQLLSEQLMITRQDGLVDSIDEIIEMFLVGSATIRSGVSKEFYW